MKPEFADYWDVQLRYRGYFVYDRRRHDPRHRRDMDMQLWESPEHLRDSAVWDGLWDRRPR